MCEGRANVGSRPFRAVLSYQGLFGAEHFQPVQERTNLLQDGIAGLLIQLSSLVPESKTQPPPSILSRGGGAGLSVLVTRSRSDRCHGRIRNGGWFRERRGSHPTEQYGIAGSRAHCFAIWSLWSKRHVQSRRKVADSALPEVIT